MDNDEKLIAYSQFSIKDLEKQLGEEKVVGNRNLIRKIIRKKRNEGNSFSTEIEKIEDISTLNKMLLESTDFFEQCKIRSTILHMEKLKKHSIPGKITDESQSDVFKISKPNEIKELIKDEITNDSQTDIIFHVKDSIKLKWILPFKVLSSIECNWLFNNTPIDKNNKIYGFAEKFNGREVFMEINNLEKENSGLYKVVVNSTRLKKTFQVFNVIVNDQSVMGKSKVIEEELVFVNNDKVEIPTLCQVENKHESPGRTRRFHRSVLNHRHRTLGGDEFTEAIKQTRENNSFRTDVQKIETTKVPIRKFNRSATSAKDIILTFCKINTKEYIDQGVCVENMSSSWSDGLAFCALIHHFYPDSFDFSTLKPTNRRQNFELAFQTAEKYADIYPVLDVEDMMIMEKPDWKCIFTYVQSYYKTFRDHPLNGLRAMIVSEKI